MHMIKQQAHAVWRGGLKQGSGSFRAGTVAGQYSFSSRFEGGAGSTPEELIAAAHASCFSMALALLLEEHGLTPDAINTTAMVHLDAQQLAITRIELHTEHLEEVVKRYRSDCIPELFPTIEFFLGHMEVIKRVRNLYSHMFPCITKQDCTLAKRGTHINSRLQKNPS
jgi:osmotically inducible protein OsmC